MNVSPDILRRDTVQLINQIDRQIEEIRKYATSIGTEPHKLHSHDGNWVMPPLLLAKAQAYNTLVLLQEKKK